MASILSVHSDALSSKPWRFKQMTINWKRVVMAGIWSELLLLAIYIPTIRNTIAFPTFAILAILVLVFLGPMFLGGLWVARKIQSHFVLHGVLVGIWANILYVPLIAVLWRMMGHQVISRSRGMDPQATLILGIIFVVLKVLGAAAGAYVGGIRRKKLLSAQTG
jgi:hypothetical protein